MRIGAVIRLARIALIAGVVMASVIVLVRGWVVLPSGHDVNLVSGVWLALARDLHDGVFYRALVDAGQYGGTRYFPLVFLLIAGWMRAGLPAMMAGQLVGLLSGAVLLTGAFSLLTRLSVARPLAITGAMLTVAPYFVLESIFGIRAEPLAAGLAFWGASFVAGRLCGSASRHWAAAAALCFGLAAAAKPTAVYAAFAGLLALLGTGRRGDALRLATLCTAVWSVLLAGIWMASDGRAIESFRACALAGETPWAFFRPETILHPIRLIFTSHYLTTVLLLIMGVMISRPRDALRLPGLLFVLALIAAVAALATPGTILTNQIVESYASGSLYLVWVAHARLELRPAGYAVFAVLLLWSSAQNGRDLGVLMREQVPKTVSVERAALIAAVQRCPGTVLSESPLLPVLAGDRPVLLDPFAFRVAAMKKPELTDDLVARLRAREFACVVLEMDPQTERGRGWYTNVHLGAPILDALLAHYTYRGSLAGRRFYVPS